MLLVIDAEPRTRKYWLHIIDQLETNLDKVPEDKQKPLVEIMEAVLLSWSTSAIALNKLIELTQTLQEEEGTHDL